MARYRFKHFAECKRTKDDIAVADGLALTPQKIMDLAREGKPIQSLELSADYFDDGTKEKGFDVQPFRQRGVDIATAWQEQQTAKKKTSQFLKQQKQQQSE